MAKDLVLASSNQGKLTELRELLLPLGLNLRSQSEFGLDSAEETEQTFLGNALLKARHASGGIDLPALADDSGLVVDALDGAPGVYSARYAGEDGTATENNSKLCQELARIDSSFVNFTARFQCVLVLVRNPQDNSPIIAEGTWEGRIIEQPRGLNGFGYDPHFFVDEEGCTSAELPRARKNELSHRGQAVRRLLEMIRDSDLT
ncbi:MAG: RdgB/HAM1 family non-canonical purine NTP pyrophosphatase [Gammaproteobacteria bacterium]|nr:RdgB/HAM1 family non-canonical purine NTP pyrophosphatase [Gammaproteobacteria bacterium]